MTSVASHLPNSPLPKARDISLDIAKGIGISLVVFGHVINGLTAARIVGTQDFIQNIYYIIYTFHMPLFFFLSGLTVERSLAKGTTNFLKGKAATIIVPYVVWSVLQGLSQTVASDSLNNPFKIQYILDIYISPIGHFWFLYSLMICHLIAAAVSGRQAFLIGVAIIALVASQYSTGLIAQTGYHFAFYAAGVVLHRGMSLLPTDWRRAVPAGIAALAACVALDLIVAPYINWRYSHPAVIPAAALGLTGVLLISRIPAAWTISQVAAYAGRLSLSIYVMHVMACAGARIFLLKAGVPHIPAVYIIVGTLSGIMLPMIIHEIFRRLHVLAYLGLERMGNPMPQRAAVKPSIVE